jgi:Domain of unknown function (DUF1851)
MFGWGKKKGAGGGEGVHWPTDPTLDDLIALGAYRRFTETDLAAIADDVAAAFPEFSGRITMFGCDWLGRVFATDSARGGEVLMLEPGTAEALEIPVDFAEFEASELVDNPDAALALGFYQSWREAGGAAPGPGQCIGYRKPLFLGGADTIDNLELVDLSVYWSVTAQVIAQVRG